MEKSILSSHPLKEVELLTHGVGGQTVYQCDEQSDSCGSADKRGITLHKSLYD